MEWLIISLQLIAACFKMQNKCINKPLISSECWTKTPKVSTKQYKCATPSREKAPKSNRKQEDPTPQNSAVNTLNPQQKMKETFTMNHHQMKTQVIIQVIWLILMLILLCRVKETIVHQVKL